MTRILRILRATQRSQQQSRSQAMPMFEPLEPRLLLDAHMPALLAEPIAPPNEGFPQEAIEVGLNEHEHSPAQPAEGADGTQPWSRPIFHMNPSFDLDSLVQRAQGDSGISDAIRTRLADIGQPNERVQIADATHIYEDLHQGVNETLDSIVNRTIVAIEEVVVHIGEAAERFGSALPAFAEGGTEQPTDFEEGYGIPEQSPLRTNLSAHKAAVDAARARQSAALAEGVNGLVERSKEVAENATNMLEESLGNTENELDIAVELDRGLQELAEEASRVGEELRVQAQSLQVRIDEFFSEILTKVLP